MSVFLLIVSPVDGHPLSKPEEDAERAMWPFLRRPYSMWKVGNFAWLLDSSCEDAESAAVSIGGQFPGGERIFAAKVSDTIGSRGFDAGVIAGITACLSERTRRETLPF